MSQVTADLVDRLEGPRASASTAPASTIDLPAPTLSAHATLRHALETRHSERAFLPDALSLQVLGSLLWAACGVNRAAIGGRTAPTACDWREIDVHVVLPEGAWRYDPDGHRLVRTCTDDLRALTGMQGYAATAPVDLVYVADESRMEGADPAQRTLLAAVDAGLVAQNVSLYCAAEGLGTVVRALVDRRPLAAALGLGPDQRITIAQSVGWPASAAARADAH
jgi:hypothetical protein